jgi:hypothetical protein
MEVLCWTETIPSYLPDFKDILKIAMVRSFETLVSTLHTTGTTSLQMFPEAEELFPESGS